MNAAKNSRPLLKIHLIGGGLCLAITAGSVWFAADSVAKRRGLFLSARHELTTAKAELNDVVATRSSLVSQVQRLEKITSEQLDLTPVSQLNARSTEIAAHAEATSISLDSLQPLELIRSDARVPVQPLELVGGALADDLASFLDVLRDEMPDIHVQELQLVSESLGTDRVRVRLMLYWFVDPADQI